VALGAGLALGAAEAAGFDRGVDAEVFGGGGTDISTLRNAAASSSSSESEYSGSGSGATGFETFFGALLGALTVVLGFFEGLRRDY
jgi:hypothetical protein